MKELADMVRDPSSSGVYVLQSDSSYQDLERLVTGNGLALFHVKGKDIGTKEQLLAAIADKLRFPDYFGSNWDALEDCLTDMSWHKTEGFVILCDESDTLAKQSPEEWEIALDILHDSAKFWHDQQKLFLVLLLGASDNTKQRLTAVRY
jgi:hypothetical protein